MSDAVVGPEPEVSGTAAIGQLVDDPIRRSLCCLGCDKLRLDPGLLVWSRMSRVDARR